MTFAAIAFPSVERGVNSTLNPVEFKVVLDTGLVVTVCLTDMEAKRLGDDLLATSETCKHIWSPVPAKNEVGAKEFCGLCAAIR